MTETKHHHSDYEINQALIAVLDEKNKAATQAGICILAASAFVCLKGGNINEIVWSLFLPGDYSTNSSFSLFPLGTVVGFFLGKYFSKSVWFARMMKEANVRKR